MAQPGTIPLDSRMSSLPCTSTRPGPRSFVPHSRRMATVRDEMVRVHARFHGRAGTFAHFGDSITETLAFWSPLEARPQGTPHHSMEHAFRRVEAHLRPGMLARLEGPGVR